MSKDWEINPDKYLKDENGEFLLKLDGTPRKKSGRTKGSKSRGYTYHSQTKAKMTAKKSFKQKEKRLKSAQAKVERYKKSITKTKKTLNKLEGKESSTILEDVDLKDIPETLATEAQEDVIFRANKGPQEDFLASSETDV